MGSLLCDYRPVSTMGRRVFPADVQGTGNILRCRGDRVVPRRLVSTSADFHRQAFGVEPPTVSASRWQGGTCQGL